MFVSQPRVWFFGCVCVSGWREKKKKLNSANNEEMRKSQTLPHERTKQHENALTQSYHFDQTNKFRLKEKTKNNNIIIFPALPTIVR